MLDLALIEIRLHDVQSHNRRQANGVHTKNEKRILFFEELAAEAICPCTGGRETITTAAAAAASHGA